MHDSARSHGIYINKGCHNLVIRNVTSENNRGNSGTQINAAGGGTKNGLVERCILRGNAQGFSLMGAIDCAFRNNIVVNNCFDGPRESGRRELILWTYAESKDVPGTICEGNIFENNTFVNTVPQGHTIEQLVHSKSGTKNCVFRNNIFVIRGKNVFRLESFDGFAFQNNCLLNIDGGQQVAGSGRLPAFATSNRLTESGTVEGDPLFADVANGDFRLKEGSPCIDAGVKTDNPASVAGRGRDIGALEKGAEALVGCRLTWRGDR
jgi:parallel beta-helix repeat protein